MDGEKCHRKTHENYGKPVRFLTMPMQNKAYRKIKNYEYKLIK